MYVLLVFLGTQLLSWKLSLSRQNIHWIIRQILICQEYLFRKGVPRG